MIFVGYTSNKQPVEEIINAILYKLKTDVRWYLLPVKSLFQICLKVGNRFIIIIVNDVKLIFMQMYYKNSISRFG
jgi:hypothetical protein